MKRLTLVLITLLIASAHAQAQAIEHIYHYNQPSVSTIQGYQQLNLEGCLPTGHVGEPSLPWQNVSLILPQGQEAISMDVEFLDYEELEGSFNLYPYQQPRPYSNEEEIPFAKNELLYRSQEPYPSLGYGSVNTQHLNGVAFAFGGFTPVLYTPATGKVQLARTVKVTITTTASRDDHSRKLWLTPENEASIKRLAQNADLLSSYNKRGREASDYDMLVITSEAWASQFGQYLDLYNNKGIRTHIVTLEAIYAATAGSDQQEQIRNHIIQEYENHGISMVSLGGDISIVPYRSLWCFAQEGYEDQLPADMYYACLDGTLNDDNDDRWGEVGEDDLLPELGIGRLPFNNETQFQTIMHKIFSYLQEPVLGEFTSPILGAEHLGDGYYGSTDLERLVGTNSDYGYTTHGYTPNYTIKRYYETQNKKWSGAEFKQFIGTGGQYVHHVGHANTTIVASWDASTMDNNFFAKNDGINHNFMLFHSHGCICGDFSHACILERMVTIPTGFVVTTGNSRYGWYEPWGDGMAAHIHREFVNAYCHEHIPSVGMALREAKIATAPWVTVYGENGCLRWNIYCLNVIGDGALCPWFDEPFMPNVTFENGLTTGTTSTTVHVSHFDEPLDNFRVSLFSGNDMVSCALTDANGNAVLDFSPALGVTGELQLFVTGQSAWPQMFELEAINGNEAFVYGDITSLDSAPQYGTQLWVGGDLYNKGNVSAHQVHAFITSDCDYVVPQSGDFTIDEFGANTSQHFDQIGQIEIANNIPDQTTFMLYLTTQVGNDIHTTQKQFLAQAPNMQFTDFSISDNGNNDGYADPGEDCSLLIDVSNLGHALASNSYLTITCDNPELYLDAEQYEIGTIAPDGHSIVEAGFHTDPDLLSGTLFHVNLAIHAGEYVTTYDYLLTVGVTLETFESGDFSFIGWDHVGDMHWFVTDDEAHSGTYSARSGDIANSEITRLRIYADILIDGEISFYFKTSTEYKHDYFAFFVDGKRKDWWSGENDWTYASYSFEAGSHLFEWLYAKSPNNIAGSDCAWIDDITFPRTIIVTKVEEITSPNTLIYPNPCNGTFTIELEEESNVTIFNAFGQKISEYQKVSGIRQIPLENAPKGLYLIQIQNGDTVDTKKLIIQ